MVQEQTMAKIQLRITFTATCVCCCKSFPQGKNSPQKESPVLLHQSLCEFTQNICVWVQLHINIYARWLLACAHLFFHMLLYYHMVCDMNQRIIRAQMALRPPSSLHMSEPCAICFMNAQVLYDTRVMSSFIRQAQRIKPCMLHQCRASLQ